MSAFRGKVVDKIWRCRLQRVRAWMICELGFEPKSLVSLSQSMIEIKAVIRCLCSPVCRQQWTSKFRTIVRSAPSHKVQMKFHRLTLPRTVSGSEKYRLEPCLPCIYTTIGRARDSTRTLNFDLLGVIKDTWSRRATKLGLICGKRFLLYLTAATTRYCRPSEVFIGTIFSE